MQTAVANNDAVEALSTNNGIIPSNLVEQKTQRTNELMLKWNIDCNYIFTPSEWQDLISMASECPAKGWYVAQSRNIINALGGALMNYIDECENTEVGNKEIRKEENINTANELKNEFLLFPNPNNGKMELQYVIHNKGSAQLLINDVTGRLINEYELSENNRNLQINESELKAGVCFYTVKQNNSILKQAKFVIMK